MTKEKRVRALVVEDEEGNLLMRESLERRVMWKSEKRVEIDKEKASQNIGS